MGQKISGKGIYAQIAEAFVAIGRIILLAGKANNGVKKHSLAVSNLSLKDAGFA